MHRFVLIRLLQFIPTLVIIILLGFALTLCTPGDPLDRLLTISPTNNESNNIEQINNQKAYWHHALGYDLPLFYIQIHALSYYNKINNLINTNDKILVNQLIDKSGNAAASMAVYHAIVALQGTDRNAYFIHKNNSDSLKISNETINNFTEYLNNLSSINTNLPVLIGDCNSFTKQENFMYSNDLLKKINKYNTAVNVYYSTFEQYKNFIPIIQFNSNNQFHRWIFGDGNMFIGSKSTYSKGLIRGDLGVSYITKDKISKLFADRVPWSFFFTILATILAYITSIPLGIYLAQNRNTRFAKILNIIITAMPAIPAFWMATLLLMFFANTDMFAWLPASGIKPILGYPVGSTLLQKVWITIPYLILPIFCFTYGSVAFLSKTLKNSILENMHQDYVRTAYSKGLWHKEVLYTHVLKNSLLPIITLLANVFPAAIGGSVIIETIFSLPGMGSSIYSAIQSQDYPVIIAVFTITACATMVGYLVVDILYSFLDPRIKLN